MRDEDGRPPRQHPGKRVLDHALAHRVQGARRFVEDQVLGIVQQRPGNRQALTLAAG